MLLRCHVSCAARRRGVRSGVPTALSRLPAMPSSQMKHLSAVVSDTTVAVLQQNAVDSMRAISEEQLQRSSLLRPGVMPRPFFLMAHCYPTSQAAPSAMVPQRVHRQKRQKKFRHYLNLSKPCDHPQYQALVTRGRQLLLKYRRERASQQASSASSSSSC